MANISELQEDFELGYDGDTITITDTIFDTINGPGSDATYYAVSYEGGLAMRIDSTTGNKFYRTNITALTSMWAGFALRIDSLPTSIITVYGGYQGTAIGYTVRVTTTGELQLRDGTITRFTSPALTLNEWYWVSAKFDIGSSTGAELRLYDRTGTSVYSSGAGAATSTTATSIDNIRVGFLAGTGSMIVSLDRLRADTTTEIAPLLTGSMEVETEASPAMPDAYDSVTLTATVSGDAGTHSYTWSQISGSPTVALSGTGNTRTFVAPPVTDIDVDLIFRCEVSSTTGTTASYDAVVPIQPHNFWTMHGGSLSPRRVNTRDAGNLVP